MKYEVSHTEDGVVLTVSGVMKKEEAKKLAEEISSIAKSKPGKLALDCSELTAVAFDSVPFLVSALDRARLGKKNVRAFNCNSVVERTFRGSDFERVATLG